MKTLLAILLGGGLVGGIGLPAANVALKTIVFPPAVKFAENGGQYMWLAYGKCYIGLNIQDTMVGQSVYISLESDNTNHEPELAIVAQPDGTALLQVPGEKPVNLRQAARVLNKLIASEFPEWPDDNGGEE